MGIFDFFSKKDNPEDKANPPKGNVFKDGEGPLENIEFENGIVLPRAFADHWHQIKATGIDSIEIKAEPADHIKTTASNFGSLPFIPEGFDYPKDIDNNPMIPLAQLNFAEMPRLDGYPEKGLLQFYISNNDTYGWDYDNLCNQETFRVIYIENPETLAEDQNVDFIRELIGSENTPVYKPHKLNFSKKTQYMGVGDYRCEQHPFSMYDWIKDYDEDTKDTLEELSYDLFCEGGHRVGGYAYFTQTDPRESGTKHSLLLLQIDTDEEIMWGDCGVGNFFISPEDLANKNFSNVMYSWDCC